MSDQVISLTLVQQHLDVAVRLGLLDLADEVSATIVDSFPGDLHARAILGEVRFEQGQPDDACRELAFVLVRDPENVRSLVAVGIAHNAAGRLTEASRALEQAFALNPQHAEVRDILQRLREQSCAETDDSDEPTTSIVRRMIREGAYRAALVVAQERLAVDPNDLLLTLSRAEALWRVGDHDQAERVCRRALARHPVLLKPRLILGQILSADPRREVEGLELLHLALAEDPGGTVAQSLFAGTDFCPPRLGDSFDIALPEALASRLLALDVEMLDHAAPARELDGAAPGLTAELETEAVTAPGETDLAASESLEQEEMFPNLVSATAEADNQADESGDLTMESDGQADPDEPRSEDATETTDLASEAAASSPVKLTERLLAVTSRAAITARYGPDGYERLERRVRSVSRELAAVGTELDLAVVDDTFSMAGFQVEPVTGSEAAEIKRAIDDVKRVLLDRSGVAGTRLGIMLLGGDEILPFFRVPNPADDDDTSILTDNPYGMAADDWLLAPSVPVGRLPDGAAGNLSLLLRQVDNLVEARRFPRLQPDGRGLLKAGWWALHSLGVGRSPLAAFACATPDLEGIASEVVATLAPGATIQLSPPAVASKFDNRWLADRRFVYFGLDGRPGGETWYGHEALDLLESTAMVPITLTPEQLAGAVLQGPVIFSAVGYSADINGRSATNSIALRFLSEGVAAFVGSTSACYGACQSPVAGADLLGSQFLRHLRQGRSTGEALQRARRDLARLEWEHQGYLDGDDQKTLLQFVLFGDPLMPVCVASHDEETEVAVDVPSGDLLCNQIPARSFGPVPAGIVRSGVEYLSQLCPTATSGSIRVHRRAACDHSCSQPGHQVTLPASSTVGTEITTVSTRIDLDGPNGARLSKIARVSVAQDGSVVKALISR